MLTEHAVAAHHQTMENQRRIAQLTQELRKSPREDLLMMCEVLGVQPDNESDESLREALLGLLH